jgi:hypothetical protein
MRAKLILAIALLAAFLTAIAAPIPASAHSRAIYYRNGDVVYVHHRSKKRQAAIIAGSAGGGALIGGLAAGGKGALVGGAAGAVGGTAYNLATRHKHKRVYRVYR